MKKKSKHEQKIELLKKEIEVLKLKLELSKIVQVPNVNTWTFRPNIIDFCIDGHPHSYPFIWNGSIQPPTCLKCGKASHTNFTITSAAGPQHSEFIQNAILSNDKITLKS